MNCEKIYKDLIIRAQGRVLEGYGEVHHILPRCLGGTDNPLNLVKLTAEEHYVAHQLLVKLNPKHEGLAYAALMMSVSNGVHKRSNKLYGWLKKQASETRRGKPGNLPSEEGRKKISETQRGKIVSEETRAKISEANTGKSPSEEVRKKLSEANSGKKLPEEQKLKMSLASKGKPKSAEARARMSASKKGKPGRPMSEESITKMLASRKLNAELKKSKQI
jgi:hypothetical protein